ncbi:hypothetical protein [Parafilimonas terrae]|jgi:hypothetical protein|uniref:Uncharacterized protein n=1 Tax=Parafilimonas terrae TaxID=1465490 RepID=A0A1I5SBY1_9BACT|nr:hypothetical protein [Parafilimonas terrae]SFP68229.1 hypothetical protein SAMN05444277_101691 [Parafilimonas terrae]
MKKLAFIFSITLLFLVQANTADAQCSICTKTASQLGEKQGKGLNGGIIYLMFTPLTIAGFLGYRWWRSEKALKDGEAEKNN